MQLKNPAILKTDCYVGGRWLRAASGKEIKVQNPATGETLAAVPSLSRDEAGRAVAQAAAAWPAWRDMSALQRSGYIRRFHDLIQENLDDLATILTSEQGKPLAEAKGELGGGLSYLAWYAEEGRRVYGEVIPSPWPGKQPLTIRQPVGLVAAVTPWNFPSSMITRKAAPALAAGCAIIFKPASQTPLSALALAGLAEAAGLPAGVFNVITGQSGEVGPELTQNPLVRKFSFTGSTAVGKTLMAQCASTVKRISLELGGNAPFLVFADADLEVAAAGAVASKFRNSGQTCVCTNRILVEQSVQEAFVGLLLAKVKALKVGNGLEAGVTQGPLIDLPSLEKVEHLVNGSLAMGAQALIGGRRHALGGQFYEPTVLTQVSPAMPVCQQEIFGPVAPVIGFASEAEAIALANDTNYGLASYLYTRDLGRAFRVSAALEYGLVGVNDVALASGEVPFGGVKESGLGREGGRQGIEEYLETKFVLMGGLGA